MYSVVITDGVERADFRLPSTAVRSSMIPFTARQGRLVARTLLVCVQYSRSAINHGSASDKSGEVPPAHPLNQYRLKINS
jgi:hypothetical protein